MNRSPAEAAQDTCGEIAKTKKLAFRRNVCYSVEKGCMVVTVSPRNAEEGQV